ncbi:hypothetical protein [Herbidospora solisilvae]|nr:hypothetical protein [Herbidospora solisilvae]
MRTFLLFLLYHLVVTPAGLIARVVRDPLSRRADADTTTYWVPSDGRHR